MAINIERRAQLKEAQAQVLETLIAGYEPEKVILFGDLLSDEIEEWSDLSLVVIKETDKPFLQRSKEAALLCRASVGVDFLIYTPEEFEQMVAEQNPFILEDVIKKGKVLYERTQRQQPSRAVA